jgi:4'-phosphopantetheinyl transferase
MESRREDHASEACGTKLRFGAPAVGVFGRDITMQLHLARIPTLLEPRQFLGCLALLDGEEQNRLVRLRFDRDRHRFAVGHAFLRRTLARYVNLAPDQLRFVVNRYGKPCLDGPAAESALHFNLAHTRDLVVVGVSRDGEIGVDVERLDLDGDLLELTAGLFSPAEIADLRATPPTERRLRFFQYWTVKEAYVKARGRGLSMALDRFTIQLLAGGRAALATTPPGERGAGTWRVFRFEPDPEHVVAWCAASRAGSTPSRWVWTEEPVHAGAGWPVDEPRDLPRRPQLERHSESTHSRRHERSSSVPAALPALPAGPPSQAPAIPLVVCRDFPPEPQETTCESTAAA